MKRYKPSESSLTEKSANVSIGAITQRLAPWLALANLASTSVDGLDSDASERAISEVFTKAHKQKTRLSLASLIDRETDYLAPVDFLGQRDTEMDRVRARKFFEIGRTIYSVFDQLTARATNPEIYRYSELAALGFPPANSQLIKPVEVSGLGQAFGTLINVDSGGVLRVGSSALVLLLQKALDGVELTRLRRCPVCSKIYYAVRANKGACDEHLGVARVWRLRKKIPDYNQNKRINRLVRKGHSIKQARAAVTKKKEKSL
jgi:hypothetical protein